VSTLENELLLFYTEGDEATDKASSKAASSLEGELASLRGGGDKATDNAATSLQCRQQTN
jgi:hypothetical protein